MATAPSPKLSAIGVLVLTRLLPVTAKGETAAKIQKDLGPLLEHRWPGAALAEQIQRALDELAANGLLLLLRGKAKKSALKVLPTVEGRRQALAILGIDELKPKTTWATLKKIHLPAHVLGLSAATDALIKAIASDPGFRAILLKQQFQLPAVELPRLDDVLDALAWRLIGFEATGRKFTLKAVKTALFNRAVGDGRATDFKKAANQLLAQRLGARRDGCQELREAILRGWIDQHFDAGAVGTDGHQEPALPITASQVEFDLHAFAKRVKAAAGACTSGRYGSNKVFVAHVWRALQSDPLVPKMSLGDFKHRLAQANNARLLDLSRADLVQAMDPDDVRQSEVQYLNATFHFVRI